MRALLALLCCAALALVACESEPEARPASAEPARTDARPASAEPSSASAAGRDVLGCAQRAEGAPGLPVFDAARDWVAAPVTFFGMRDEARRARRRPAGVARRYERGWGAIKILLAVPAGETVRVAIAPRSRDMAGLVYGAPAGGNGPLDRLDEAKRTVTFKACTADHPRFDDKGTVGDTTTFAGGFLIAKAGCLGMVVTPQGEAPRRHVLAYGVATRRCAPGSA